VESQVEIAGDDVVGLALEGSDSPTQDYLEETVDRIEVDFARR
jgi:hypothetical protein